MRVSREKEDTRIPLLGDGHPSWRASSVCQTPSYEASCTQRPTFAGEIDTYQVWKLAICLLQFQCPSEPSLTGYFSDVPRKAGVERTSVPESCQVCLGTRAQAREGDARSSGACGR